jgi:hypothetical protein
MDLTTLLALLTLWAESVDRYLFRSPKVSSGVALSRSKRGSTPHSLRVPPPPPLALTPFVPSKANDVAHLAR